MKGKSTIAILVIVVILAIAGFAGCSSYNNMVTLNETCDNAWAKVEVQYQRRLDLIPNLVETVKGYAKHESETYENVTRARAGLTEAYNEANQLKNGDMADPETFHNYTDAQAQLNRAFNIYVNAVHEAYPDLKANAQFQDLQVQLEGTENRIATERGYYTDAVNTYNLAVKRFPGKIWASIFNMEPRPQYQAEPEAKSAPKVTF